MKLDNKLLFYDNIDNCIINLNNNDLVEKIFVIGGEQIYNYFMNNNLFSSLLLTFIMKPSINYGDSHFPFIEKDKFNFKLLENVNTEGKELKFGKNVDIEYQIYELKPLDKKFEYIFKSI